MAGTKDTPLHPKGYLKVTALSTVKSLTVPAGARYALLKAEGQAVRWRDDGTDPTVTDGMLIDVGDEFWYPGKVNAIRFLEAVAGATLHVSFYA